MAVNLLNFDSEGLVRFCADLGEKPFRAKQLLRWVHQRGEGDFSAMSDLAKSLREKLVGTAIVGNRMEIFETEDGLKYLWLNRHSFQECFKQLLFY